MTCEGKQVPLKYYPLIFTERIGGHEPRVFLDVLYTKPWVDVVICIETDGDGDIKMLIPYENIPTLIKALEEAYEKAKAIDESGKEADEK